MKIKGRYRLYLSVFWKFFRLRVKVRVLWIEWVLPFQIVNLSLSLFTWIYFSRTFGGESPLLDAYGGDYFSYLLVGLVTSGFLEYSLHAYRGSLTSMLTSHFGFPGQTITYFDYVNLSGSPPLAAMLGNVLDGYIENLIIATIYIIIGYALGFRPSASATYSMAALALLIGVLAMVGLGLISASTIVFAGTWRGTEPIAWFFTVASQVFSGIYFPVEAIPSKFRIISKVLPQTYVYRICRLAIQGLQVELSNLLTLLFFATFYMITGIILVNKAFRRVQEIPIIE